MEKIIKGKEAKKFFNNAVDELNTVHDKYLSQRLKGYFLEDGLWIAFDNTSNELFSEEFKQYQKALEYFD